MSEGKAKRKRAENLLGSFMEKRRGVSVARSLKYIFIGLFLAAALILLVVELVFLSAGYVSLSHFAVEVCLLTVIGAVVFLTSYLIVRRAVAYPLAVEENTVAGSAARIDEIDNLKLAKRVARILRESEETLRTVFDCSGDAIFIHDLDGTFLEVNRVACDRLGYSREELLKLTPMDIDTMEYAEMAPGRIKQIKKKGHLTFETAHVARDGRVIPTEISSRILIYKGQECIISTCRDITERKRAEEALRDSEAMFRSVYNASPSAMGVFDAEGQLVSVNSAALTMFRVSDLEEARVYNFFEDPVITDEMKDSLRSGESLRYERAINIKRLLKEVGVRETGKSGTVNLNVLIIPLRTEVGLPVTGYVILGQDITKHKWAEEEISRLSRRVMDEYEEARRKIAIDLHDEFGQSISALKIEVDMLRKEAGNRLEDQAERLEGMVALLEDTLDKIRSISGELRPVLLDDFGLEKALGMYVEEFSRRTGVTAGVDCAGVPVDLEKNIELSLFRIAQEALVNVARHADATRVRLSLLCEDGPLILTVTDNGQGFNVERILREDSIHSPFGILGMRERAIMVGGEFNMSSKTGKGTTVVVKVPLESQAR